MKTTADKHPHWFPAKRYGLGWGLPVTWQGWAVLVAYLVAIAAVTASLPDHPRAGAVLIAGASLLLLGICWRKGEPLRWRWGTGEKERRRKP